MRLLDMARVKEGTLDACWRGIPILVLNRFTCIFAAKSMLTLALEIMAFNESQCGCNNNDLQIT